MKIPYVVMKKSAMCQQQRISILSNEMVRRLSNCEWKNKSTIEKKVVIEQYTAELKVSGYSRKEAKEVILCGMKGWKSKMGRREKEGGKLYRSAKSTLQARCKKNLTEKTTWYKRKKNEESEEEFKERTRYRRKKEKSIEEKKKNKPSKEEGKEAKAVKAVMFVAYTPYSELAKRLRKAEEKLQEMTGYKLKIVERAGMKIEDLLHTSNPWRGETVGGMTAICALQSRAQRSRRSNAAENET